MNGQKKAGDQNIYDPWSPRPIPKKAAKRLSRKQAGAVDAADADQVEAFSPDETGEAHVNTVAAAELRQLIERIERLAEDKALIADDIKDVFGEAKGRGYDTKAIRTIIRMRRQDRDERMEEEAILQTYMAALGMV